MDIRVCELKLSDDCKKEYLYERGPGANGAYWNSGWDSVDRGLEDRRGFAVHEDCCPPCYLQYRKDEARKEYDVVWGD